MNSILIDDDKAQHFLHGVIISMMFGWLSAPIGLMIGLATGLAKEAVYDYSLKRGTPDFIDFAFTALGSYLGAVIMALLLWVLEG